MKNQLITIFIFIAACAYNLTAQNIFYVDPINGNDSNNGTIDKPFKTISQGASQTTAGGTLFLRGGNYFSTAKISLAKSGQTNNYIKIWAYQDEKPVIDFTGNSSDGISISGSYYHLKGIIVKNAGHNGINISGNYNIIENCVVRENKNTGLHLTGSGTGPSYNLILNCDACFNFDPPLGGNADGFSAKWTVGPGNVFRGCRAWNNSDDGWDLWMGTGSVVIDSCFAFRNGVDSWHTGLSGNNGNGFKLGGNYIAMSHFVYNCVSFDNAGDTGRGFDENNNTAGQTLYNCIAFRNTRSNFYFNNNPLSSGNHVIKNCISYLSGVPDAIKNASLQTNSWQGFTVSNNDFLSIDTAGAAAPRGINGRLPKSNFLRLASSSSLIDAGVDVGIPFTGKAPDLGAFEFGMPMPPVGIEKTLQLPSGYELAQNYPNPFNPGTVISYQIPEPGYVSLKVYDNLGRLVTVLVNEFLNAGVYTSRFSISNSQLSSGVYFYVLTAGNFISSRKMILLK